MFVLCSALASVPPPPATAALSRFELAAKKLVGCFRTLLESVITARVTGVIALVGGTCAEVRSAKCRMKSVRRGKRGRVFMDLLVFSKFFILHFAFLISSGIQPKLR